MLAGGNRTYSIGMRAAEDSHLVPRGHWDGLSSFLSTVNGGAFTFAAISRQTLL